MKNKDITNKKGYLIIKGIFIFNKALNRQNKWYRA